MGITFDAQRVIGSQDPHMIVPTVYFKLRAFDGTDVLPALALGYDNMGYLYQGNPRATYLPKRRKVFIWLAVNEIFVPDFDLHAGMNINDFNNTKIFGFFGVTYKIVPAFALLLEYDNIRNGPENRFNVGGRFWITPYFNVDVGARNVGRGLRRGRRAYRTSELHGSFPF